MVWEHEDQMWKITRPNRFGWTVLPGDDGYPEVSEATPLEYFVRWQITNRLFGDNLSLRGIHCTDEGSRMIVSQRFLIGSFPSSYQVKEELQDFGFRPIQTFSVGAYDDSSFFNPEPGIALFDAAKDNFIPTKGVPIPIDVIPVKVGARLRNQLLKLMT